MATTLRLHRTIGVRVGAVQVGGGAPVVVQSMTMTDTADPASTAQQCIELAEAGSEMVRVTVNLPEAAQAVPEIKQRMLDAGCTAPLIGDFHYNGHLLLTRYPACARALAKYRINPGNVGGKRHDENFRAIIEVALANDKPVRIGVNWGSLDQNLLTEMMDANARRPDPEDARDVTMAAMVESGLQSATLAEAVGMPHDRIILSAKVSGVQDLVDVYRMLAARCDYPLHLGLTEAGMGTKGTVASTAALANFALAIGRPGEARRANSAIIENAFRYSKTGACVLHFSTQSVYGDAAPTARWRWDARWQPPRPA